MAEGLQHLGGIDMLKGFLGNRTIYLALFIDSNTEVSGASYERMAVDSAMNKFTYSTSRTNGHAEAKNTGKIDFDDPTGAWTTGNNKITVLKIMTALTGGSVLWELDLTTDRVVTQSGTNVFIQPERLVLRVPVVA